MRWVKNPEKMSLHGLKVSRTRTLYRLNNHVGRGRPPIEKRLAHIEECIKAADPLYWKRLQAHAKQIGWRGEYSVVNILRKKGWFAKRSFGSWGVDVFAARNIPNVSPAGYEPQSETRVLLIDVKSSDKRLNDLTVIPMDPATRMESDRTGIPAVRAACIKGQKPRFFWYRDGTEIPLDWF